MPLQYVISKDTLSNLEEIWLYTVEKCSVEQANRYYNLIFDEIKFICKKQLQENLWSMFEKVIKHLKLNLILFSTEFKIILLK